jgi:hypothetical protein
MGCDDDCVRSSGSIGHAIVLGSVLLAACGGDVFSASQGGSDGGEDSSLDVTGAESGGDDGPSPGPDAKADVGTHPDASVHDSATGDAKTEDARTMDVSSRDVVTGGGCDAGATLTVFVTSHQFSAALGGLAGADTLCQTAATNAGLKGTFVAWLSDDSHNAVSRICPTTAPFVLVDGTTVAIGVAGLTSNQLQHAIDETETGQAAPLTPTACNDGELAVWTGTEYTGSGQPGFNCQNWTSTSANADGVVGYAQATSGAWTYGCSGTPICNGIASLYCIGQ